MNPSNLPAVAPPLQVPSEAGKRLLPWLVAFAFFMESLDTTILNTAVPAISAALHVTPLSMKAVLASYPDAKVQLVAGDVNLVGNEREYWQRRQMLIGDEAEQRQGEAPTLGSVDEFLQHVAAGQAREAWV